MTVKNETFEATLEGDAVQDAVFYYPGNAIDAMEEVLPNSWIGISNGNMFDLFFGSDEGRSKAASSPKKQGFRKAVF